MSRGTKFNKKITIKRYSTIERTATGGMKSSLTTLFTDWCYIEPMRGRKRIDMARVAYDDTKEVTMRKRNDYTITANDVAVISGVEYNIDSVYDMPDDMYVKMEISK